MENIVDITSLIDLFKFGYTGDVINLIYLFLIIRFFIFPSGCYIYKLITKKKGEIKHD